MEQHSWSRKHVRAIIEEQCLSSNHGRARMREKPQRRKHGGEPWGRNHLEGVMQGTCRQRHPGCTQAVSGRHPGRTQGISWKSPEVAQEAPRKFPGGFKKAGQSRQEAPRRHPETPRMQSGDQTSPFDQSHYPS